jgi:hypothetical protein
MDLSRPKRIYNNIAVLLAEGSFQGAAAPAVAEAAEFIASIIKEIASEEARRQEAGHSVGDAQDAAGVASSEVPPAKRKGRPRGSKPA